MQPTYLWSQYNITRHAGNAALSAVSVYKYGPFFNAVPVYSNSSTAVVLLRVPVLEFLLHLCLAPGPRPLETPLLSLRQCCRLHPLLARQIAPFPALPLELTLLCCIQVGHAVKRFTC